MPELADEALHSADREGEASATTVFGEWLGELLRLNPRDFRIFAADELRSNRLAQGVLPATPPQSSGTSKSAVSMKIWRTRAE